MTCLGHQLLKSNQRRAGWLIQVDVLPAGNDPRCSRNQIMNRCFNSHSLQPFRLQQLSLANKLHALDTLSQCSIWLDNANQLKILGQRLDSPQFSNSMWMP